jgi:hypothetical protein
MRVRSLTLLAVKDKLRLTNVRLAEAAPPAGGTGGNGKDRILTSEQAILPTTLSPI